MNLLLFADRLEEAGLGTLAKDIFVETIPLEAPKGILLRSSLNGARIDWELPGLFKTEFRLIVRAAKHADGSALVQKAIKALTIHGEQAVGAMNVRYCRPRTTPAVYPLSKGNLREFSVDFDIVFDEGPA